MMRCWSLSMLILLWTAVPNAPVGAAVAVGGRKEEEEESALRQDVSASSANKASVTQAKSNHRPHDKDPAATSTADDQSFDWRRMLSSSSSPMVTLRKDHNRALPTGYIIGGKPASNGQYPYFAVSAVLAGAPGLCGASLVARDILVSAAHCAEFFMDRKQEIGYQAIIGATSHTEGAELVDIVGVAIHPDFDSDTLDSDIMVLRIDPPVSGAITPIQINTKRDAPQDDELLKIVGLGSTSSDGTTLPEKLLEADVRAVSRTDCDSIFGKGEMLLCAWNEDPLRVPCTGDFGGPLLDRKTSGEDLLVGVASFVSEEGRCRSGSEPAGFTRVSFYNIWLKETICGSSDFAPQDLCRSPPTTAPPTPKPQEPVCYSLGDPCTPRMECCTQAPKIKCFGKRKNNSRCAFCGKHRENCKTHSDCCEFPVRAKCIKSKCTTCVSKNRKCRITSQCCHPMATCSQKNFMGMFLFVCNK